MINTVQRLKNKIIEAFKRLKIFTIVEFDKNFRFNEAGGGSLRQISQ